MLEKHQNIVGLVEAIFINKQKGMPRELIQEGRFKENFGLVGDIKSGSSDRQVSLLSLESREQLIGDYSKGLCTNRFHETIKVKGINLYEFSIGTKLMIGETIQEITVIGKSCFDECELVKNDIRCSLATQAVFTKVLKGGVVKVGDSIKLMT